MVQPIVEKNRTEGKAKKKSDEKTTTEGGKREYRSLRGGGWEKTVKELVDPTQLRNEVRPPSSLEE